MNFNKGKTFVIVFFSIALLIFPQLSKAEKTKIRVIVEKANIRLKPDLGSPIISSVPLGAVLEAEKRIGEWFKVNLPPDEKGFVVTGYVHLSMVEVIEEKPASPPPPPKKPQPPVPTYYESSGISFGLRIFGGLGYLSPSDINKGVEGVNDLWSDYLTLWGYTVKGDTKPLHLGFDFGGDIIIYFTSQIGVGFGVGYIQANRTDEIIFKNLEEGSMTNKPKITAIPIKAGIYYLIPLNSSMNFVINAGAGLYMAKAYYNWRLESDGYWREIDVEAKATGFGFHGGVGFEFAFSPNIAFFIESQGRYTNISGFEGTFEDTDSYGYTEKEEGKLYIYKTDTPFGKYYNLIISKDKPSGTYVSDTREAKVDFSGFNFIAGLRIRF